MHLEAPPHTARDGLGPTIVGVRLASPPNLGGIGIVQSASALPCPGAMGVVERRCQVSGFRSRRTLALLAVFVLVAGTVGVVAVARLTASNSPAAQVPLDSHTIPQFAQALPVLHAAGGTIKRSEEHTSEL